MMMAGTVDMAVAAGRVHGRVGRSHGRLRRRGCNRLCGDSYHRAVDGTVPTWRVHATEVVLSEAAAARRGWRGDELEPDQVGLVNRQRVCGVYVSNSTGRYGGRR